MTLRMIFIMSLCAVSLAAFVPANGFAANQTLDLSSGSASFIGTGPLLDGGDDIITFINLAPGTYNLDFSLSSQYSNISSVLVNSEAAIGTGFGSFQFFGLSSVNTSPFIVQIFGTATARSLYSGELQVTSVPEPPSYALLLTALVSLGFAARRSTITSTVS